MQYDTIASTKSALANVLAPPGIPCISAHPLIQRFSKGIYNLLPSNPRYSVIRDTTVVIDYLRSLPNNNLSIKLLFYKTVILRTLSSSQYIYGRVELQEIKYICFISCNSTLHWFRPLLCLTVDLGAPCLLCIFQGSLMRLR